MVESEIESRDIHAVFARYTIGPLISGDAVGKDREKKGCVVVMPANPCP
jgi:hypothetical protein